MIAKVVTHDFEQVNNSIQRLIELACQYQDRDVVKKMKELVPEFKSKNSIYEELDQIIEVNV